MRNKQDIREGKITGIVLNTIDPSRLPELSDRGELLVNKFNKANVRLKLIPWNRIPNYHDVDEFLSILQEHIIDHSEYDYECDSLPKVVRMMEELADAGRVYAIGIADIEEIETTAGTFTAADLAEMLEAANND